VLKVAEGDVAKGDVAEGCGGITNFEIDIRNSGKISSTFITTGNLVQNPFFFTKIHGK